MNVQEPWFSCIKNNTKQWEGRVYRGKFTTFNIGDILTIKENDESELSLIRQIDEVRRFKTFREALTEIPICDVLPGKKTLDDALAVYEKWYSIGEQLEHGVVFYRFSSHPQTI
jgi:ASC-1-like (ASCH) protein